MVSDTPEFPPNSTIQEPTMAYEIFARKYRPETFSEVVGQEAIARTLENAVSSGSVAPVYIFAGSHGVGKTSMARILAKALNCPSSLESGGVPCAKCEVCKSIAGGDALDVIEIDAASNRGIDDARQLRDGVYYRPAALRKKVYILDEFHQLSKEAFDALLKTFEEAPNHVCFILATTELHKVPNTIRSRSQVFQFKRATLEQVTKRLEQIAQSESISIDREALELVARRSRGSLRDSQKLFDQVVALSVGIDHISAKDLSELMGFAGLSKILDTLSFITNNEPAKILETVSQLYDAGQDLTVFVADLLEAFRGLLYLKTCGADSPILEDLMLDLREAKPIAEKLSQEAILYGLQLLSQSTERMRRARDERVVVEMTLIRLCELSELRPIGELLARLERLEKALSQGRGSGVGIRKDLVAGPGEPKGRTALAAPSSQNRTQAKAPTLPPLKNPVSTAKPKAPPSRPSQRTTQSPVSTGPAKPAPYLLQKLQAQWDRIRGRFNEMAMVRALERSQPILVMEDSHGPQVTLECTNIVGFLRNSLEDRKSQLESQISRVLEKPSSVLLQYVEGATKQNINTGRQKLDPIVEYAQKVLHSRLVHKPRYGSS